MIIAILSRHCCRCFEGRATSYLADMAASKTFFFSFISCTARLVTFCFLLCTVRFLFNGPPHGYAKVLFLHLILPLCFCAAFAVAPGDHEHGGGV